MSRQVALGGLTPAYFTEAGARAAVIAGIHYEEAVADEALALDADTASYSVGAQDVAFGLGRSARQITISSLMSPITLTEPSGREALFGLTVLSEAVESSSGFNLNAERAAFSLSVQDLALSAAGGLQLNRGSYTLTARAVALRADRALIADVASFESTFAGVLPTLVAVRANYATTAQDVTLTYVSSTLKLSPNAILVNVQAQAVEFGWDLAFEVEPAAFVASVQDVSFRRPLRLFVDTASYRATVASVDLVAPRIIAYPIFSKVVVAGPS